MFYSCYSNTDISIKNDSRVQEEPEYDPTLNPFGDDDDDGDEEFHDAEPQAASTPKKDERIPEVVQSSVPSPSLSTGKKCPPPKPAPPKPPRLVQTDKPRGRRHKRPAPIDPDHDAPIEEYFVFLSGCFRFV